MTTSAGVGISHHRNARVAGREAVTQALRAAKLDKPDFVFMFASVAYPQELLLAAVREAAGGAPLLGCSGEGVIAMMEADESNFSVAVMVVASDALRFRHGLETGVKGDPARVGNAVGASVANDLEDDARAVLVLADGLSFNFDPFVAGLRAEMPRRVPLFGATSADNWELKRTYQYRDDDVVSDGVVWAVLSGPVEVLWSVNHGCVPLGGERKVTRSTGNVIYEIDGKPVLEVLREYLVGDEIVNWQKAIVNLCLGFRAPVGMEDYDEYLIRFMPAKDDAAGSVTIPTEVREGCSIWMTRRDHEKIAAGLDRMGDQIQRELGGRVPVLVLQFDCAGRGKAVFRDQQKAELLQRLQQKVGPTVPWLGLYSYGEIGPVGDEDCFHNYTAVVMALA